ncbi:MAG: hypothetical protein IJT23_07300 [Clostridia bacterium]|nr:hypothetical protein [Clostridia bacterium]
MKKLSKKKLKKPVDETGTELTPSIYKYCKGNGVHKDEYGRYYEICCDECDYFLLCFPQYKK